MIKYTIYAGLRSEGAHCSKLNADDMLYRLKYVLHRYNVTAYSIIHMEGMFEGKAEPSVKVEIMQEQIDCMGLVALGKLCTFIAQYMEQDEVWYTQETVDIFKAKK